jgi:lipoprotein-anchoring transpeptidase ErfK/SrfK
VLRLQEVLASLGYLPLDFTPSTTAPAAPLGPTLPAAAQPGSFAWSAPNVPAGLSAEWSEGQANEITRGAVMAFEADHGLAVDGSAGPQVWSALSTAVAKHQVSSRTYDYIMVTETLPETLRVWQGGRIVYTTPANTGAAGAPTALGTFPVYERFVTTTMRGTNPNGSKYVDPGIPWVAYFNGGDAIHGFVRPGYGYPQSDGCVELPPSHAQVMFPLDYYGTLVTVT